MLYYLRFCVWSDVFELNKICVCHCFHSFFVLFNGFYTYTSSVRKKMREKDRFIPLCSSFDAAAAAAHLNFTHSHPPSHALFVFRLLCKFHDSVDESRLTTLSSSKINTNTLYLKRFQGIETIVVVEAAAAAFVVSACACVFV